MSLEEALPILRAVASAIDAAHAEGIAHRDVKPENVFVLPEGRVVLIDFGLAKLTREELSVTESGSVFGTPLYMSPEQCRGRAVDVRTDAYSFGVMAYQVLAGAPPFAGSALELALQHLNEAPPPIADAPKRVSDAVLALLAKDPAERPLPLVRAIDAMSGGARVAPKRRWWWVAVPVLAAAILAGVVLTRRGRAAWTVRELPLRIDGYANFAFLSAGGSELYFTQSVGGQRRLNLTTEEVSPTDVQLAGFLDDGARVLRRSDGFEIERAESTKRITAEDGDVVSPDGTRLATASVAGISIADVETGEMRLLTKPTGILASYGWSRDGRWLLWVDTGADVSHFHATDVTTGATTELEWPIFQRSSPIDAIAQLPDGRFVYCAEDSSGPSLRVRDFNTGAEEVIAPLDEYTANCQVHTAATGRVAVTVSSGLARAAMIELTGARPELDPIDTGPQRTAFGYTRDETGLFTRPIRGDQNAVTVVSIARHTETKQKACNGDVDVAVRNGLLVHFTQQGDLYELRDADCRSLAEVRLDLAGVWNGLTCNQTQCAIAQHLNGTVTIWKIDAAFQEIARLRYEADPRSVLALSHDGRYLVGTNRDENGPFLVDLSTHSLQVLPFETAQFRVVQSVAWGDSPDHFLATTINIGEFKSSLFRSDLLGSREFLWGSKTDWFQISGERSTGKTVVGRAREPRTHFLILDPP